VLVTVINIHHTRFTTDTLVLLRNLFLCTKILNTNKMLNYRRETTLKVR